MLAGLAISPLGDLSLPAGQPIRIQILTTDLDGNPIDLSQQSLALVICVDDETANVIQAVQLNTSDTINGNPAWGAFTGAHTRAAFLAQQSGLVLCLGVAGSVEGGTEWLRLGRFITKPAPGFFAAAVNTDLAGPAVVFGVKQSQSTVDFNLHLIGAPGPAQYDLLGYASPEEYQREQNAAAIVPLAPGQPAHGTAIGGEETLQAPDAVPAASPWWVRLLVNGAIQRPGVDFTSDDTSTLHLNFALAAGDDWFIEQLQRIAL